MDSSIASASPPAFDSLHPSTPRSMAEAVAWITGLAARVVPCSLLAACMPADGYIRLREALVLNVSYPTHWIGWYLATRADQVDPVLQQARRHGTCFAWPGHALGIPARGTEEFLHMAAQYGLEAGAIAAHRGPDGYCTILATAGACGHPYEAWIPDLLLRAHLAHAGLAALARAQQAALAFTERQVRILHALRMGLQDNETAALLGLSSTTIRTHLSHLMRRTGLCRARALALLDEWQPLSVIPHHVQLGIAHPLPWQLRLFA